MKTASRILVLSAGIAAVSCGAHRQAHQPGSAIQAPATESVASADRGSIIRSEERLGWQARQVMPRGVVYRMSGDYAGHVPVTLTADGKLQSYPAPSDVTPESLPVALDGGWWLDRRGVSTRSVFTSYTYDEYSSLAEVPTQSQLLEAVIPGARVISVLQLPMTTAEAVADTASVNAFIRRTSISLHK